MRKQSRAEVCPRLSEQGPEQRQIDFFFPKHEEQKLECRLDQSWWPVGPSSTQLELSQPQRAEGRGRRAGSVGLWHLGSPCLLHMAGHLPE